MKKRLLLFISFAIFINANAQIGFKDHTIIDETYFLLNGKSIYSVDIDNDGDMDLLSASLYDEKIAWYENLDGKGNFGIQQVITTSAKGAISVYADDIDGDGDMDVLSASYGDDKIAWYKNMDGKGNFSEQIIVDYFENLETIRTADMDGDGDLDIIPSANFDNFIAWYENIDGEGNFSKKKVINSTYTSYRYFAIEDLDGDNDLDIVSDYSLNDGEFYWHENIDGKGTFVQKQTITQSTYSRHFLVYDPDKDEDMDIISITDSDILWYENTDGNGVFDNEPIIIDDNHGILTSIKTGDLDGDSFLDIVAFSKENYLIWYKNNDGNYSSKTVIDINTLLINQIILEDLDGDNDMDIACIFNSKIAWYENIDGFGTFSTQKELNSNSAYFVNSVHAADLNGDGGLDVLSSSRGDNKIAWYKNIEEATSFDNQKLISKDLDFVSNVFTSDIDGDGDMDVLSASNGDGVIAWYENIDGEGDFGTQQIISSNAVEANHVNTADIDGDGDLDVLSASSEDGKIAWYENLDGTGNFGSEQIIFTSFFKASYVSSDDIDGDGDLDVLSASGKISWYKNVDGEGNFGPEQVIVNVSGDKFTTNDIDNDGYVDIVCAEDKFNGNITWYKNIDGLGNFSLQQTIGSVNLTSNVLSFDIDNDGDNDIISGSEYDSEVFWYENLNGLGDFGTKQIINTNVDKPVHLYETDLDKDGDLDVLCASSSDSKIVWFENLGILKNEINGSISIDYNSDGCDINDLVFQNLKVVTDNGTESLATFSLENGFYQLFPDEGDFITEITSILPDYYEANPSFHTSNFTGVGSTDTSDFCLVPNQTINDLNITLLPTSQARPGFDASYQIVFRNVGTAKLNGEIRLEFDDSKLSFLTASQIVTSQNTNSLTFDYSILNPFETRTIDLDFNIIAPPTTEIGNILTFTATINPISGDYTENDNIFKLNQTVIGSYDPNDIKVLEGEQVLIEDADEYLHYIIRFQNTGTADAINVRVDNILDPNLDWNTIQLESSSHSNRVEIKDGNEVSFIFNGIYLPDSTTDEPNSHGFIAYKIKPKDTIDIGDVMQNKADIFFDFNLPIITNTVNTKIVETLSVNENKLSSFQMYPNPTTGVFNIKSKSKISEIQIYNNLGQIVLRHIDKTNIDVSLLNTGFYFMKIKDEIGNSEIIKFIKE